MIEFYGMTETASAPIACNPLPPRQRKPGSVGFPVGLDVAIMAKVEFCCPSAVRRGRSSFVARPSRAVTTTMANEAAFAGDWFETGDCGFFDEDGYLFLIGRSQEIIDRGRKNRPAGNRRCPPGAPGCRGGRHLLPPPTPLWARTSRQRSCWAGSCCHIERHSSVCHRARSRLKVPRQVLVVEAPPKSPTGKVQRVGLAEKLGLSSRTATPQNFVAPRRPLEKMLAEFWAEVLQVGQIGIHDDF